MSVSVSFSTESKRENSTKQLTMSTTHSCNFKNGCSMLKPTLFLEIDTDNFPTYTAFKIENRYYNVTDIKSVRNNLFEISGEVDVLATYKSNILATTAYVIYDTVSNTEIPDNRLPMVTTKSVSASTAACPLVPSTGTYILSLTGAHGSTGIYKCNISDIGSLIDDLQDIYDNLFDYETQHPAPTPPTSSHDVADWVKYWTEYFSWLWGAIKYPISQIFGSGNIPENIRECRLIPFDIGTSYGPNKIYLGTFETQQSFGKLNTDTVHRTASVSIPWQANDYRRRSPFTEIYLYLPYIGMTKLSSENLVGQSSISVAYTVALRDGSLVCTVSSGSEIIGQYSGNVGVSVPIGFSNINIPRAAASIIEGATAAVKKDLGGVGMAALSFGDAVTPNFSCIGGLDGMASTAANQNITCYTVFHDTNVAPNTELMTIGSPTMAPKSLGSLTGYVQTMSASVAGAMTSDERTKLNTMLDSGIFIE